MSKERQADLAAIEAAPDGAMVAVSDPLLAYNPRKPLGSEFRLAEGILRGVVLPPLSMEVTAAIGARLAFYLGRSISEAVLAEREACAKLADNWAEMERRALRGGDPTAMEYLAKELDNLAEEIRARATPSQ